MQRHIGHPNNRDVGDRYPQSGGKKIGNCKLAWMSAVSSSRKLLLRLEETS